LIYTIFLPFRETAATTTSPKSATAASASPNPTAAGPVLAPHARQPSRSRGRTARIGSPEPAAGRPARPAFAAGGSRLSQGHTAGRLAQVAPVPAASSRWQEAPRVSSRACGQRPACDGACGSRGQACVRLHLHSGQVFPGGVISPARGNPPRRDAHQAGSSGARTC